MSLNARRGSSIMLINKNWIDTMPSEWHGMVYGIVPVGVCGEWFDSHTFTCVNVRMQPDWQPKQSTEKLRVQHRLNVFVWCLSVSGHHYYIFIQKIGVCCYFKAQNKVFALSVAPTRQSTWGSSQKRAVCVCMVVWDISVNETCPHTAVSSLS